MLPDDDPRKSLINESLITYVEDRKGHDRRYAISPDKMRKETGWTPDTKFTKGIRLTVEWYLNHPEWMENVTSGEYQNYYRKLYESRIG